MEKLLSRRLPLAWLFMWLITLTSFGIIATLVMQGGAPSNAVLIESVDEEVEERPTEGGNTGALFSLDAQTSGTQPITSPSPTLNLIAVYVSGAVNSPGVYTLAPGSRWNDALLRAGGASGDADLERINLAAIVSDQQHIHVPRIGEVIAEDPGVTAQASRPTPGSGVKLDLNRATLSELEELPGIGPVLARRIMEDRDKHGPFRSVDDLKRVPGIKDALLSRVRDYVSVQP